jgi:hypothetical protein
MTVNLSPLGGAAAQFFDNNGVILTGGKLYTYAAGTTTPQSTYTSISGATPHTNPIIMDSAGRIPGGEVWLTDGASYKFTLETSTGVLLGTYDNVAAIPSINAGSIEYDPPFTGSLTSGYTVADKLAQTVSVKDFGAVGDGVANDTAAIQAALNTGRSVFIPEGSFFFNLPLYYTANDQAIFGEGNTSILKHRGIGSSGPSWIETSGFDNVSLVNLQIDGGYTTQAGNPGLWVTNGSVNVAVDSVYFNGGNQVVYLGDCSDVKVVNSSFYKTGFGVIQRQGFTSSNVLVDGNTCLDAYLDFVEANCISTNPSENWVISNNTYNTNSNFPSANRDRLFVGITSVRGVVITGNTVKKSAGDAAIHLEDTLGDTIIADNVFDNCLTSGGNLGYIFLLNTAENTIVSNNIFLRTDATLPAAYALSVNSDVYSFALIASGNLVRGESGSSNFSGFNLGFQDNLSSTVCSGNIFQDLDEGIEVSNTQNAIIDGNVFNRCASPILTPLTLVNSLISNNNFVATTGTDDISLVASTKVDVQNNKFSKRVDLGSSTDVFVNDNSFATTASLIGPNGTRAFAPANMFASVGVSQARYLNNGTLRTLSASKSTSNVSGSAATTFRITASATDANWQPGSIRIEASACDGNGSILTSAWWNYKFNVLGSNTSTNEAVSDSGGTVGSYSVSFVNVSTSATEVVFDVTVTATGADFSAVDLSATYYGNIVSIV